MTGGVHFSLHTVHFGRHRQIERDFGALFIRALFGFGLEFLSKTSWVNGQHTKLQITQINFLTSTVKRRDVIFCLWCAYFPLLQ